MRARHGAIALVFSAACTYQGDQPTESASAALGTVPTTETAQWTRAGATNLPDERYGHALAFDQTRGLVVMFGGWAGSPSMGQTAHQDTWEWDPTLGAWKDRTAGGSKPDIRTGAAMAYDSTRKIFVLFGGRAGSGYDLQDTWEWDPATGVWTDKTGAGAKPDARSQHGMLYDSKNAKILLFGGGRNQVGGDVTTLSSCFADTWEYDGATGAWAKRTTTLAPSARSDFGFAYSSDTGKAYLFGGQEVLTVSDPGTPKQDTWEWDGAAGTWTERTLTGTKPSARFAHSMAIDSVKGQATIFGGYDIGTGGGKNDVWVLNLSTGAWAVHEQAATVTAWPAQRLWASMVFNPATSRLLVVAGLINDYNSPYSNVMGPTREVWELDTTTTTWVNRSAPSNSPGFRYSHATATDPVTGKVYVFGGVDTMGVSRDDLWEWNGDKWVECTGDTKPSGRDETAMAYDPVRKSFILFGGNSYNSGGMFEMLSDTWEWSIATRKWTQLFPTQSPTGRMLHAMVTDTTRKKIILYSGSSPYYYPPYATPVDAGVPTKSAVSTEYQVWEWDGANSTWTDRSPPQSFAQPTVMLPPVLTYDETRKKVASFTADSYGTANYWEWDPESGGWAQRLVNDTVTISGNAVVAYDSIRRRMIEVGADYNKMIPIATATDTTISLSTYELEPITPTWYLSKASGPSERYQETMAFDSRRGVMVMFGGSSAITGFPMDETWEYKVSGWGNGEGCTADFAARCASGNCVDGVCCESASCTGACKSCNVPGKAGTCVLASPGTQVVGSCSGDQACDATGACKISNGKGCSSAADCASGFCTDGVCCDGACTGACKSCNLPGKVGTCSPQAVGTDPEKECGLGTAPCQSTCNGAGACSYPTNITCGTCGTCNGSGSCYESPYCSTSGIRTSRLTGTITAISTTPGTGITTAIATSPGTSVFTGGTATFTGATASYTGTNTAPTGTVTGTGTGSLSTARGTGTGTGSQLTSTATATRTGATATATATNTATAATATGTSTATTRTGSGTAIATGVGTGDLTAPRTVNTTATNTGSMTPSSTSTQTATAGVPDAGTTTPRDGGTPRADASADQGGKTNMKLGQGGCSCELGGSSAKGYDMQGLLAILGAFLVWRRTRKSR
jgi:hypothetical protein